MINNNGTKDSGGFHHTMPLINYFNKIVESFFWILIDCSAFSLATFWWGCGLQTAAFLSSPFEKLKQLGTQAAAAMPPMPHMNTSANKPTSAAPAPTGGSDVTVGFFLLRVSIYAS